MSPASSPTPSETGAEPATTFPTMPSHSPAVAAIRRPLLPHPKLPVAISHYKTHARNSLSIFSPIPRAPRTLSGSLHAASFRRRSLATFGRPPAPLPPSPRVVACTASFATSRESSPATSLSLATTEITSSTTHPSHPCHSQPSAAVWRHSLPPHAAPLPPSRSPHPTVPRPPLQATGNPPELRPPRVPVSSTTSSAFDRFFPPPHASSHSPNPSIAFPRLPHTPVAPSPLLRLPDRHPADAAAISYCQRVLPATAARCLPPPPLLFPSSTASRVRHRVVPPSPAIRHCLARLYGEPALPHLAVWVAKIPI